MNYQHLYIHIPFCSRKCSYCAFYSESGSSASLRGQYLSVLKEQLERHSTSLQNIKTIFMGGGTPSLLTASELDNLFSTIHQYTNTSGLLEWSMESNPETLTTDRIAVMKNAGVNRVSIGIQSFQPELRKIIGRHASPEFIAKTVEALIATGIDNINFDLIYGIPGQTIDMWLNDLKKAATFPISHISAYSLTVEEGSDIAEANMKVDDEEAVLMQEKGTKLLQEHGFERYEISNYCRNDRKCLHNNGIWHGDTYLGLGPTAASFDGSKRFHQPSSLAAWIKGAPAEEDIISAKDRAREVFVIGLRTIAGWNLQEFKKKTGFELNDLYKNEVEKLVDDGFLLLSTTTVSPTAKGLLYADYMAVELI